MNPSMRKRIRELLARHRLSSIKLGLGFIVQEVKTLKELGEILALKKVIHHRDYLHHSLQSYRHSEYIYVYLLGWLASQRSPITQGLKDLRLNSYLSEEIPENISNLICLERIVINSGRITKLPAALSTLSHLRELEITRQRLNTFPDVLYSCSQLESLSLKFNPLRNLPEGQPLFTRLRKLDLSRNRLPELPAWISAQPDNACSQSSFFRLEHQSQEALILPKVIVDYRLKPDLTREMMRAIRHFPRVLCNKVTALNLESYCVTTLPDVILQFAQLEEFNLSDNEIDQVPDCFARLSKLKSLNLTMNPLQYIPDGLRALQLDADQWSKHRSVIIQMQSLRQLILSDCNIIKLPDDFVLLSRLESLDISINSIIELPEFLSQFIELSVFKIRQNELQAIPKWLSMLTQLKTLDLGENHIEMLPQSMANLMTLEELFVDDNRLRSFPKSFQSLCAVRVLHADRNPLEDIGFGLSHWTRLESLTLSHNTLTHIPSLGNPSILKKIHISDTAIKVVPSWLSNCTGLRELIFSSNKTREQELPLTCFPQLNTLVLRDMGLTRFPVGIENLSNLSHIDVEKNSITALPQDWGRLTRLKHINLSRNRISILPDKMSAFLDLEVLLLAHNPLEARHSFEPLFSYLDWTQGI